MPIKVKLCYIQAFEQKKQCLGNLIANSDQH